MTAVATSGTTLWSTNRDAIITRALRIIGAAGQGDTAYTASITEGAEALNDMVKAWEADGMPLWKVRQQGPFTLTATNSFQIGTGSTFSAPAPLKILQAWLKDTSVTPNTDTPLLIVTDQDYQYLNAKTSTGQPSQLVYTVPGANIITVSDAVGTIKLYPSPDTYSVSNRTLYLVSQLPFEDFVASTDVPDFPQYWYDAIKWGLAAELCSEYGLPLAERGFIVKMAQDKKMEALLYGVEEGSLFLRPTVQYNSPGGSQY